MCSWVKKRIWKEFNPIGTDSSLTSIIIQACATRSHSSEKSKYSFLRALHIYASWVPRHRSFFFLSRRLQLLSTQINSFFSFYFACFLWLLRPSLTFFFFFFFLCLPELPFMITFFWTFLHSLQIVSLLSLFMVYWEVIYSVAFFISLAFFISFVKSAVCLSFSLSFSFSFSLCIGRGWRLHRLDLCIGIRLS